MKNIISVFFLFISIQSVLAIDKHSITISDATAIAMLKFTQFDARFKQRADGIKIHVINADNIAASLEKLKNSVSEFPHYSVKSSETLPDTPVDIIFVGKSSNIAELSRYAIKHKTLTVTNHKGYFNDGISVGILENRNKISISLNTSQSVDEGANWQFDYSTIGTMTIEFKGKLN